MTISRMLKSPAAAHYVGVEPGTMPVWRHRGVGPPYHRVNRAVLYAVEDLDSWLARVRIVPSA